MKSTIATVLLGAALAAPALAQTRTLPPPPTAADAESALITYVVQDSVSEIAVCKLALTVSKNAAVRSFAQTMIREHSQILDRAMALGTKRAIPNLEAMPSDDGRVNYVHLTKYTGHPFDENFMNQNVSDHLNDIEVLRHASEITTSPDVKTFETALLPQYEHHLQLAQHAEDLESREE